MRSTKSNILIAFAALACLAWTSGWLTGLLVDPGTWPQRYLLLGAGFFIAVGLVGWTLWQMLGEQRLAARYLEVLALVDVRKLADSGGGAELPAIAEKHPWHEHLLRFKELMVASAEKLREMEHTRAALEIRAQRSADSHQRMTAILSGLNDPVLAVDQYGELLLANERARELFGIDESIAQEVAADDVITSTPLLETLNEVIRHRGHTQRVCELELPGPDGQFRWYAATARTVALVTADDASVHGAVVVLRDISGQKQIQKRNAEFVSAVSHEMKTPLSGIKAYVELLADGDAEDEATREEFLDVINTQADRLQRLIDNLLNLARIEAGVVDVNKHTQSLNEVLEEALGVVQPAAEAKQITLERQLSSLYLGVHVDHDMFLQAVINLLSNAVKYTPAGGQVALRSRTHDDEVVVQVADTGVGLSEEDRQRVFEKFFRVRKDREMAAGTGLGLPLARHIVEDVHNGHLTVESELGKGSTFTITVPSAGQMSARAPVPNA